MDSHSMSTSIFCCIRKSPAEHFKPTTPPIIQPSTPVATKETKEDISNTNSPNIRKFSAFTRRLSQEKIRKKFSSISPQPIDFLTAKERHFICQSWKAIPDKAELGERIYIHIFVQKPALQRLFPFADTPTEVIREHPDFRRQANSFSQFLQSVVDYVSSNDSLRLRALCTWTGERHARITRIRFQAEWWQLFANALVNCIQPYCRSAPAVMDAWHRLLEELLNEMQESFERARRDLPDTMSASSGQFQAVCYNSSRPVSSPSDEQSTTSASFGGGANQCPARSNGTYSSSLESVSLSEFKQKEHT